jgi:hypothetical protein
MKICTKCQVSKSLTEFHKNRTRKDGLNEQCKSCRKSEHKERYSDIETRARILGRAKKRYHNDPEKYKQKVSRRAFELKLRAVNILGGRCFVCGEDHPAKLQFHHRNPAEKLFCLSHGSTLSKTKQISWAQIVAEINKCDLLCANCHFLHHSNWDEFWKEIKSNQ